MRIPVANMQISSFKTISQIPIKPLKVFIRSPATLEKSLNPFDTWRALKSHKYSVTDVQYAVTLALAVFSLIVADEEQRTFLGQLFTTISVSLCFPITRQFTLPYLSILNWGMLWFHYR